MAWSVAELAEGKTTFSKKELKDLGVKGLTSHSYVETANGKYFQPITKSNTSKMRELSVMAKVRACKRAQRRSLRANHKTPRS